MLDERNFLDTAYVKKRDECDQIEQDVRRLNRCINDLMDNYCYASVREQSVEQKVQCLKELFSQKITLCQELQHLLNQEKHFRDEERDHFRKSLQEIES